jgi:hypothetical protein
MVALNGWRLKCSQAEGGCLVERFGFNLNPMGRAVRLGQRHQARTHGHRGDAAFENRLRQKAASYRNLLCLDQSASERERFRRFLRGKQRGRSSRSVHERLNFLCRSVTSAWSVILWPDGGRTFIQELLLFIGQAVGAKLPPPRQMFALEIGLILWREVPKAFESLTGIEAHEGVICHARGLGADGCRD